MNRIGRITSVLGLAVVGIAIAQPAAAQGYLMPETPKKGVWMEAAHPNLKDIEITAPSTSWFLSGRLPVFDRAWGVADVPFAYGKLDVGTASDDGNLVLGNPYLGLEYMATHRVMLEAGGRLPLTTADDSSFGDVVGYLSDPLRGEAFMMDVVPVSAAANFFHTLPQGVSLRARGGMLSAIYTGDEEDLETTNFLDYGFFGSYPRGIARFGAGVSGRWDVTTEDGDFSDNSLHQLGLTADALFRGVRPGIVVRVPLDEVHRDVVGSTVGLYLHVPLR